MQTMISIYMNEKGGNASSDRDPGTGGNKKAGPGGQFKGVHPPRHITAEKKTGAHLDRGTE